MIDLEELKNRLIMAIDVGKSIPGEHSRGAIQAYIHVSRWITELEEQDYKDNHAGKI